MSKFRFSIDRGGTFTDIYAEIPTPEGGHEGIVYKLLSENPATYDDAPREGIRRLMEQHLGVPIPTAQDIPTEKIEWIRMGTTVATNALLERKGEPCALVITKGFKDLLKIGNQSRPNIFDLRIDRPDLVYSTVVEVDERVRILSKEEQPPAPTSELSETEFKTPLTISETPQEGKFRKGLSGDWFEVLKDVDVEQLERDLKAVRDQGISSLSVSLVHSYAFPYHEHTVHQIAKSIGFTHVSLSSAVMPMVRIVPRGLTSCVDAYLTPHITKYVRSFSAGFKDNLKGVNVLFMQSDGGLTPADKFSGSRAILSGPAGGVVGYAQTCYNGKDPVIGFDMGGTSTDVSRYAGKLEHVFETQVAGVTLQAPQLAVQTVAAGGGSRLFFRSGRFVVGPESSSAHPGPICYRKNGYLAVTDANVYLGRLLPDHFPPIFGPMENQPLDVDATRKAFEDLTVEINEFLRAQGSHEMTPDEVAYGFVQVANESMCRPIRSMTVSKGFDTRDHTLACFGGAGPQHACEIAQDLGMSTVLVHKYSSVLSAYGLSLADVVTDLQEPCSLVFSSDSLPVLRERLSHLNARASESLVAQGFPEDKIEVEEFLNLRYKGTDFAIMTPFLSDVDPLIAFTQKYRKEYGFDLGSRPILVDDIRVRGVGHTQNNGNSKKSEKIEIPTTTKKSEIPEPIGYSQTYFQGLGRTRTPVFSLGSLTQSTPPIHGPAIIVQKTTQITVLPGCHATITTTGDVCLKVGGGESGGSSGKKVISAEGPVDSVLMSIFANRFMSIAEQMGYTLQRTSISTNIKERLDFSCALFGPDGGLVANAPHLPVHLGSMSEAVKFQISYLGDDWKEGDVVLSNHPRAGGSHLPDLTVITPVFEGGRPVFFVASRGHHADIGGITPGSMPPFSRYIHEEGAAIKSLKIVKNGIFQEPDVLEAFSGSRAKGDNISDLKAQIAANHKGIKLVGELIGQYTLPVVQAYMKHVQNSAEFAVRDMLQTLSVTRGLKPIDIVHATDYMDDGTPIVLNLTIDRNERTAHFDFTGTGPQILGNLNAPKAVALSAILYCLRCLVNTDIPLNQGCLMPIKVTIPEGSLLCPGENAAVVGGNVLTSQRVTDVVLKAFGACADSQGCMNNLTFGNSKMGYYETICGGAGAGPGWHGRDAVHTHMTNTRITDVEIFERQYPTLIRQFSVRPDSGGKGKWNGGCGCIREIEFLDDLTVGILSERRAFAPCGLVGGQPGAKGQNLLIRADGETFNLGGKNSFSVSKGDRIVIMTPGGGGYGIPEI